jgi:hypothetical protein
MSGELRDASVAALCALGRSREYQDRADAGRSLAAFAESREAARMLQELILDSEDTYVTRVTAEAVLRRKDRAGMLVVISAMVGADSNHEDWVNSAIVDAFGVFSRDRDAALRICREIAYESDDVISLGARQMVDILNEIEPVLEFPGS